MIRKFRVCFYLRSYKTKDGKSPILVRLYLNGERMILGSAGFNVEEKQWDKSKGRVKGRTSEANKVNEALERIELDLMHLYGRRPRSAGSRDRAYPTMSITHQYRKP